MYTRGTQNIKIKAEKKPKFSIGQICPKFKYDSLIGKDENGTIWINWLRIKRMKYLGLETIDQAKITARNDVNYLTARDGQIPNEIKNIRIMADGDKYKETVLGMLKEDDLFIYFGSINSTTYRVKSNDGKQIKYFIPNATKLGDHRNYTIDLDKSYRSYGCRFYRRVLLVTLELGLGKKIMFG